MRLLFTIVLCLLLSSCNNRIVDKKEAFLLLSRDTSILPAIEHFSVLVNPDSLQDNRDLPVIIHALVSNGNDLRYCILSATRLNEQYKGAKVIGETECNGYKVVFHTRGTSLSNILLQNTPLNDSDYRAIDDEDRDYYFDVYDKDRYSVWFDITENASLQYRFIFARSPEEMLEWGIDIRERVKKIK